MLIYDIAPVSEQPKQRPSTVMAKLLRSAFVLVAALLGLLPLSAKAGDHNYRLATATPGGTYYPVGQAISALVESKLHKTPSISIAVLATAGSSENLDLLRLGKAEFGILQSLHGVYAWSGRGSSQQHGPQKDLRAVTMLWPEVEQFVVRSEFAKTGTIEDLIALKGSAMALGEANSGAIETNRLLLKNLGIDIDRDFKLFHGSYEASADAVVSGQVIGMGTPSGIPTEAVTRTFAAMGKGVRLLSFTPSQISKTLAGLGAWTNHTIKAGTYPGQDSSVQTIAQFSFLAVRAGVPEEDVYRITQALYDNLPTLHRVHQATKEMRLDSALLGLPVPLHPGAAKFYTENGIKVPSRLIVK